MTKFFGYYFFCRKNRKDVTKRYLFDKINMNRIRGMESEFIKS